MFGGDGEDGRRDCSLNIVTCNNSGGMDSLICILDEGVVSYGCYHGSNKTCILNHAFFGSIYASASLKVVFLI